jgi:hypothetical protein
MEQPQIDLTKTTIVETSEGGKIWAQGYTLRNIKVYTPGTSEDALIPIPIFYDPETKEILGDTLPKEIKDEYLTIIKKWIILNT